MTHDITDPHAFFENLVHDLGPKAMPERRSYLPGEFIVQEGAPIRRMLVVQEGEVAVTQGNRHICRYIPANRYDALPILSASDYCYCSGSSYTYVAETEVKTLSIDTRMLIDMGKKRTNLVLFRNLVLFSDMGVVLRKKIAEEFERTGLMCFSPEVSEENILRYHPDVFEEYYLDFALRVMGEITVGRMVRSDHPSTAIAAFQKPAWMTANKSF